MSDKVIASYSFLPWLRQGITNQITTQSTDGTILRATVQVNVNLEVTKPNNEVDNTHEVNQTINLYGPGDVIGIDSKAIIKCEPRNRITNFEANYLPYIDFYDEDFPWRYTPAKVNENKLTPWLTLVVLKETEFTENKNTKNKPLASFKLKSGVEKSKVFPPVNQLWAWAHVHVNEDLSGNVPLNEINEESVNNAIKNVINKNPDRTYSRLISSRRLENNTGYHTFLIPTFESGRLAGLNMDFPLDSGGEINLRANEIAWVNEANFEFPFYYRWYFKTADVGDFEYLVNLLQPKIADKTVGVRDMDVLNAGSDLPAIQVPGLDEEHLKGILRLGGALRVPRDTLGTADKNEANSFDNWNKANYPSEFSTAMAKKINLADDYKNSTKPILELNSEAGIIAGETTDEEGEITIVYDADPVITSPLYGEWHALQKRLLIDQQNQALPYNDNWVHELNLDPRFRVAAGLGTKVIQTNQELYMHKAWLQIGDVLKANYLIQLGILSKITSDRIYNKHLVNLKSDRALQILSPMHSKIILNDFTIRHNFIESVVPVEMVSGKFRSLARPRGALAKRLNITAQLANGNLIEQVNEGKIVIEPPVITPPEAVTKDDVKDAVEAKNIPPFFKNLIKKCKRINLYLIIALIICLIIGFSTKSPIVDNILTLVVILIVFLFFFLRKWKNDIQLEQYFADENQTPEAVDDLPKSPDFTLSVAIDNFRPGKGNTDSAEAIRFKTALKDYREMLAVKVEEKPKKKLDVLAVISTSIAGIKPKITIPKRLLGTIKIPSNFKVEMYEYFAPVMNHPKFDTPMYKPLADISSELFLPNIDKIEQNSITLLENNQKFIEAYMVGLNHEMSRELLWREYPTDQRGSYFRQFWDVNGVADEEDVDPEDLLDIPPIHTWSKKNTGLFSSSGEEVIRKNDLGAHNQRTMESGKMQLVLVIRGELLKRYPNAVIYAHKASWNRHESTNELQFHENRDLAEMNEEVQGKTSKDLIKFPLYEAKIDPDIYFFGFDLDDEEARGNLNPTVESDNAGWFFVIKEVPGEPRFGLDIENDGKLLNWNMFSWKHIETTTGETIQLNKDIPLSTPSGNDEKKETDDDDQQVLRWNSSLNAAQIAYVLYQMPVMVAVHASRMLPKNP